MKARRLPTARCGAPLHRARPDSASQNLHCRFRGECLWAARTWPGMSCAGCPDYERMSVVEFRADLDGLASLLALIMGGPGTRALRVGSLTGGGVPRSNAPYECGRDDRRTAGQGTERVIRAPLDLLEGGAGRHLVVLRVSQEARARARTASDGGGAVLHRDLAVLEPRPVGDARGLGLSLAGQQDGAGLPSSRGQAHPAALAVVVGPSALVAVAALLSPTPPAFAFRGVCAVNQARGPPSSSRVHAPWFTSARVSRVVTSTNFIAARSTLRKNPRGSLGW